MNNLIQANTTSLDFKCQSYSKQIIFWWKQDEVSGVEIGWVEGAFKWKHTETLIEDGVMGRCIVDITSPLNEEATPSTKTMVFHFKGIGNYNQAITITLNQEASNQDPYVILDKSSIVSGFAFYESVVPYQASGCTVNNVSGSTGLYPYEQDGAIRVMAWWNNIIPVGQLFLKARVKVEYVVDATQAPGVEEMEVFILAPRMCPIWKDLDVHYSNPDTEYMDYSIYDTTDGITLRDTPIYRGRSYRMPGARTIEYNLNKVVEPFLEEDVDLDHTGVNDVSTYGTSFTVKAGPRDEFIGTYVFFDDWTYTDIKRPYGIKQVISRSLTDRYVKGSTFVASAWNPNANPSPGSGGQQYEYVKESPDGKNYTPVEAIGDVWLHPFGFNTLVVKPEDFKPDTKYIKVIGKVWKVDDRCSKFVVHYKGATGGYASFPIYGNVNVYSEARPYEMNRTFKNTTSRFEKARYLNEMTERYEATFPFLDKETARHIDEITQSTQVWLEDIAGGRMIPVLPDITETDFKNNRKIRNYTINFLTSQDRLRK